MLIVISNIYRYETCGTKKCYILGCLCVHLFSPICIPSIKQNNILQKTLKHFNKIGSGFNFTKLICIIQYLHTRQYIFQLLLYFFPKKIIFIKMVVKLEWNTNHTVA